MNLKKRIFYVFQDTVFEKIEVITVPLFNYLKNACVWYGIYKIMFKIRNVTFIFQNFQKKFQKRKKNWKNSNVFKKIK